MGLILLRPDVDLQEKFILVPIEPLLDGFWYIATRHTCITHGVNLVTITKNDGQFVYAIYRILAYICVSTLVIFFKINFVAKTRISLLIYEWEEWEVVSEFELHLNEYYEREVKDMKYFTSWYLFKKTNNNVFTKSLHQVSEFSRQLTQSTLNYE